MNIFSSIELKIHRFYTQIFFANYGRYKDKITLLKIRKNALKYININERILNKCQPGKESQIAPKSEYC